MVDPFDAFDVLNDALEDALQQYVYGFSDARAVRLELDVMVLLDKGVPLDDIEIIFPETSERPYVRQISNG